MWRDSISITFSKNSVFFCAPFTEAQWCGWPKWLGYYWKREQGASVEYWWSSAQSRLLASLTCRGPPLFSSALLQTLPPSCPNGAFRSRSADGKEAAFKKLRSGSRSRPRAECAGLPSGVSLYGAKCCQRKENSERRNWAAKHKVKLNIMENFWSEAWCEEVPDGEIEAK